MYYGLRNFPSKPPFFAGGAVGVNAEGTPTGAVPTVASGDGAPTRVTTPGVGAATGGATTAGGATAAGAAGVPNVAPGTIIC